MSNFFSQQPNMQSLIEQDGVEKVTDKLAIVISGMLPDRMLARQFVLEEIEKLIKLTGESPEEIFIAAMPS